MKLNRRTYNYQRPEEEMDNPYIPELPTSTPADAPVRDPSIFDPDGTNPGPYKRPDFTPTWWDPDGDGNPGGGGPLNIPNLTPGIPGFDEPPIEIPFLPDNPIQLPPVFVPGKPGIFPDPSILKNPLRIPVREPAFLPKRITKRDPDGDGRPGEPGREYEPEWWNDPVQFPEPPGWPDGQPWPPAWPDPEAENPPAWWPPAWNWPPVPEDYRNANFG